MGKSYFLCPLCGNRLVETLEPCYRGFICEKCGFSNMYEEGVPICVPSIYYIDDKQGNRQCGPVSPLDVVITPDTYVWMENMKDWTQARNVRELFFFFKCPEKKVRFTYQTEKAATAGKALFAIEQQMKGETLLYKAEAINGLEKMAYWELLGIYPFSLFLGIAIAYDSRLVVLGFLIGVLGPLLFIPLLLYMRRVGARYNHYIDSVFITSESIWANVDDTWHHIALDYIQKCKISFLERRGERDSVFLKVRTNRGEKIEIDLSDVEIDLKKFTEVLNVAAKREIISPWTFHKILFLHLLPYSPITIGLLIIFVAWLHDNM